MSIRVYAAAWAKIPMAASAPIVTGNHSILRISSMLFVPMSFVCCIAISKGHTQARRAVGHHSGQGIHGGWRNAR